MDSSISENEILIVVFIGILMMLLLAVAFVLFFYFSQKKFQAQQLEAQQKELEYQEQLLYSNIEAQEKERQRIARELHDDIGSKLNVINLSLYRLKKQQPESSATTLNELFGVVKTTLDTTRRISHDLLPPVLENFGLVAALKELCEKYRAASGLDISLAAEETANTLLEKSIALNLFRAIQELLSNTLKYAHATQILIQLDQHGRQLTLSYRDNGQGFDLADANFQKGLGLKNIESRMKMISADYQLQSQPGKGVFFQAKLNQ
jgi:signal transduction histidine kinase